MSAAVWWSSHSNRQIGVVAGAAMGGKIGGVTTAPLFGSDAKWMGYVGGYSPVGAVGSTGGRNGHLREIGAVGGEVKDVFI